MEGQKPFFRKSRIFKQKTKQPAETKEKERDTVLALRHIQYSVSVSVTHNTKIEKVSVPHGHFR